MNSIDLEVWRKGKIMTVKQFNFSGHPVAGFEIAPFVGANLPADGESLRAYVRETLLSLPGREDLLRGASAEVVLPGLSQAAGIVLAEWHGQFGSFPSIRWAVRTDQGFTWPDTATADLADVRETARTAR